MNQTYLKGILFVDAIFKTFYQEKTCKGFSLYETSKMYFILRRFVVSPSNKDQKNILFL